MAKIEIKELETKPFLELFDLHHKNIFNDTQFFDFQKVLSKEETIKSSKLKEERAPPLRINLGIFYNGEFAGWSWGFQSLSSVFYMCNSAILPEFRRKGLYTLLLNEMLRKTTDLGFLEIGSRHLPQNNAVIIPKLKAGFIITGMNVSDLWGTLVYLTYFPNPTRRKVLAYRNGYQPDDEVKNLLSL